MSAKPHISFHVDFNWDRLGNIASPGLFSQANARDHIEWYKRLGVDTLYSFCTTVNGFAWYDSRIAPMTPGLESEFAVELAELGKAQQWTVMGYVCAGANAYWRRLHPDENHAVARWHIPLTERYLDYLSASIRDALGKMPIDGLMLDWLLEVRPTWLTCERIMYQELFGEAFPSVPVPPDVVTEFCRRAVERAWERIRSTTQEAKPGTLLCLSLNNGDRPQIQGSALLADADWVVNDFPDVSMLAGLRAQCKATARLWQCVGGWGESQSGERPEAAALLRALDGPSEVEIGLHGFARADEITTLPPEDDGRNARSIASLRQLQGGG